MRTVLSRIRLNKKQIILVCVFMLLSSVGEMLLPTFLAKMIDGGVGADSRGTIVKLAVVMAFTAVIACAASVLATSISAIITTKFSKDLRSEIFWKTQSFSAADMDKFDTSSLVTRSTSDITNIQMFLSMLMRIGIMAPLMAVAGLVLSSATGGKVSSVLNTAIPLFLILSAVIIIISSAYSVKLRSKIDRINQLFLETLEGVRVIRAFNKQEHEMKRFHDCNADYTKTSVTSARISGVLSPMINLIFGLTAAAVMAAGAYYVYKDEMEVGALVANTQYISMILMSVIMLAMVIMMFPMSYACAKRIAEVLNTEPVITDEEKSASDKSSKGNIVFRNVTFAYPNADAPVLKGISFESRAGEITAVIGSTGCGKSSILKLIPRMYDTLFLRSLC